MKRIRKNMTIKKRLFLFYILMLIIPVLVSILVIIVSAFTFVNLFYKQIMDEAVAMVEKWEQQYINDQQFEYMQNQQNEMLREIESLNREVNYLACENSTLRSMYRF